MGNNEGIQRVRCRCGVIVIIPSRHGNVSCAACRHTAFRVMAHEYREPEDNDDEPAEPVIAWGEK